MRTLIILVSTLLPWSANADIFNYKCKANGKLLYAKIDTLANTFQWRGKTYKIVEQPECAKYGWRASGNGRSFDACTATRGYLDFEDENGQTAVCGLK